MKIISVVLYAAAVGFCVLGLTGHPAAWAAAALSFFAATMMMVGRQKDKRAKTETKDNIRRKDHERKDYGDFERAGYP